MNELKGGLMTEMMRGRGPISIAIDGPAGAGKSTIARKLAQRLHIAYLDTGAMYRALTWLALQRGVAFDDSAGLVRLLESQALGVVVSAETTRITCGEVDVTAKLHNPEVSDGASMVSQHPDVRAQLVAWQRRIGERESIVMDGRDIGTVVLPQAEVKLFLTASVRERAERRYRELNDAGLSLQQVEEQIAQRDARDTTRAASPLRQAEDAVVIDTSGKGIDEVLDVILGLLNERGLGGLGHDMV